MSLTMLQLIANELAGEDTHGTMPKFERDKPDTISHSLAHLIGEMQKHIGPCKRCSKVLEDKQRSGK